MIRRCVDQLIQERLRTEGKLLHFDIFAPVERLARQAGGYGYQVVDRLGDPAGKRRAVVMKHSPDAHKLVIVHDRDSRQTMAFHNDAFDPADVDPQRMSGGQLPAFLRSIHQHRRQGRGGVYEVESP